MDKEIEVSENLLKAFKFILYNKYEDLEDNLKEDYGKIGSYLMNVIISVFEYLKQHPQVLDYIQKNYPEFFEGK